MKPTALITGGSRGIGFGIARQLAGSGFDLAVNGTRQEDRVEEQLQELRDAGSTVIYARGDVSRAAHRQASYETVIGSFGHLNVLVNNAGVAPEERRDILEATEDSFARVMDINLKGPYFLTQLFANHMVGKKKEDSGYDCCIINVTSVSSTMASVNRGEYCMSKAALSMATRLWAVRLGEYDIPVYEIQPGITLTDMTAGVKEKYDRMIADGLCVQRRWGVPEDVGKVAAAMATGSMPYSTGQVVVTDGGMTLPRL